MSREKKGYESPNAHPAGRHAPTLLQAGVVFAPTYFLTEVLVGKADRFAEDQYFEGSAYLNNGKYPAILGGIATGLVMLQLVAIVSPRLFDWLLEDGSRLRRFMRWASEALSSLGRRPAGQDDDSAESMDDEDTPLLPATVPTSPAIEFDDDVAATHPHWRNAYNIFLRGMTALSLHTASFAMVAVLPAGDAALRFALAKYYGYTDQEVEAACQALAITGITALPVIQFFNMLAANAILNYRDKPPRASRRTILEELLYHVNNLFANMGVIRSAAESDSRAALIRRVKCMRDGSIQHFIEMGALVQEGSGRPTQVVSLARAQPGLWPEGRRPSASATFVPVGGFTPEENEENRSSSSFSSVSSNQK